ncbi:hypothetical protein CBM2587_U30011 [Cupriavidus taiwanensis]|uniref:Uncharacterized protein n=1 Tax=Cupriavidus taiwanensis TaxID=164546 RepID=A0A375CJW1_9BURK|nr:hypothetical protein CBM2587_U30011 [Cupriavidus taiwanensis]
MHDDLPQYSVLSGSTATGQSTHARVEPPKSSTWPKWATRRDRSDAQAGRCEIDRTRRVVRAVSRVEDAEGVWRGRQNVFKPSHSRQDTEIGPVTVAVGPVPTVLLMVSAQGQQQQRKQASEGAAAMLHESRQHLS